jgi:5-methylcytosine-specific restriction endonuclease McrA
VALRIDNKIEFVKLPWSISRIFSGRYSLQSGRRLLSARWKESEFQTIRDREADDPVALWRDGRRLLWVFHGSFYWEDEGLEGDDVKALVHQRERRSQQKLQTARSLMRAEEQGRPTRIPIPSDLRRAVFERDGGCCVECGSNFDLQYDHVLPVAHGGATTLENLQLLCADCNRRKSDTL